MWRSPATRRAPRWAWTRLVPLAAAGDFAYVDPDEPAANGRIVAVRADGPGGATLVRRMAVESGRSVLRAANPGRPGIAVIRAGGTMMRAVAELAGRAVRGATPRHYRSGGPEAAEGAFRGMSPGAAIR